MAPFDVVVKDVPDDALAPFLREIARAGFPHPIVIEAGATPAPASPLASPNASKTELPEEWSLIDEREGVTYAWPEETDEYDRYRVYAGTTADGTIRAAVGWTYSHRWGKERRRA